MHIYIYIVNMRYEWNEEKNKANKQKDYDNYDLR